MESAITEFISKELVSDPAVLPLAPDTSLVESGVLDSLGMLKLVMFLEQRFGIQVDPSEVVPDHFDTVTAICSYVRARTAGVG